MTKAREKYMLQSQDKDGDLFEVMIEGRTNIPFWRTDLNLSVALSLIESANIKDIRDSGLPFEKQQEIIGLLGEIKEAADNVISWQ